MFAARARTTAMTNSFKCSITNKIYLHPVVVYPSGYTYEKDAVEELMIKKMPCPKSNVQINGYMPNKTLQECIGNYLTLHPEEKRNQYTDAVKRLYTQLDAYCKEILVATLLREHEIGSSAEEMQGLNLLRLIITFLCCDELVIAHLGEQAEAIGLIKVINMFKEIFGNEKNAAEIETIIQYNKNLLNKYITTSDPAAMRLRRDQAGLLAETVIRLAISNLKSELLNKKVKEMPDDDSIKEIALEESFRLSKQMDLYLVQFQIMLSTQATLLNSLPQGLEPTMQSNGTGQRTAVRLTEQTAASAAAPARDESHASFRSSSSDSFGSSSSSSYESSSSEENLSSPSMGGRSFFFSPLPGCNLPPNKIKHTEPSQFKP